MNEKKGKYMKTREKNIFAVVALILVICTLLTGCGKKGENSNGKNVVMNYGETITVADKMNFTIKSNKIVDSIEPTNTSGYYTYIKAGENKKIFDICMDVKNISNDEIALKDFIEAKMYIGDEEVEVMYIMENVAGTNMISNAEEIKLKNDNNKEIHFATKVDKELVNKENTVKLILKENKNEYIYSANIVIGDEKVKSEGATININYKGVPIKENEKISVKDICEFTITKCEFTDKIEPSKPTGFYVYIPDEDGKKYIDLHVTVKNLSDSSVKQNQLPGTVTVFNGENETYSTNKIIEVSNGSNLNTYTSSNYIESMDTKEYHIYASVPESVQNSTNPLWVRFNIDGNKYLFSIR